MADNPEAADLVQKSLQNLESQEIDSVRDKLDKEESEMNIPTNLNEARGSLFMTEGKIE